MSISVHGSFQNLTNNWRKNKSWFTSLQSAAGRGTWKPDDGWQQMPPQASSAASNGPWPVQHQQAFISLSPRKLTSNFCFSLWWLRVSGLIPRTRLLSSRRWKLSKRCTPESWRGKTSFLSCGRKQKKRKSCTTFKNFGVINKEITPSMRGDW